MIITFIKKLGDGSMSCPSLNLSGAILVDRIIFQKGVCPDLLATSGDYLRIWKVSENSGEVKLESLLNNVSFLSILLK